MRVLSAGAVYFAANAISAAVPVLLLPFLTRALDPADYAHVVSFALLVAFCQPLAGLGVHGALGVSWFKHPREEAAAYIGTGLSIAAASTLAVACAVTLVLLFTPAGLFDLDPLWGGAAALTAGSNVILQSRLVVWRSQAKPIPSAAMQIAASVLNVSISLAAVLALHWGGAGRNFGIASTTIAMAAASSWLFWRAGLLRWSPTRAQWRYFLAFGGPLIIHGLAAVVLTTTDRWSISFRLDATSLGIYGTGAQLGMAMSVLTDAFVKAYGPWVYGRLATGDRDAGMQVVGSIYLGIPGFLALGLLVGVVLVPATSLILGAQYHGAAAVVPWFLLGGAFNGVYVCTSVLFFQATKTSRLASITVASSIVGALTTWFLTGAFGLTGAAMGYASSQALLALGTTVAAMATFDLPWKNPRQSLAIASRSIVYGLRGNR